MAKGSTDAKQQSTLAGELTYEGIASKYEC